MSKKSKRRQKARLKNLQDNPLKGEEAVVAPKERVRADKPSRSRGSKGIKAFYNDNYKQLLLIPLILLLVALCQIGYQLYTTGDFVSKGVSLKGGITMTLPDTDVDILVLEEHLMTKFNGHDVSVRKVTQAGEQSGVIIDADITDKDMINTFISAIEEKTGKLTDNDYSIEFIGSSLGQSFFKQTFKALIMAFLFMGMVVFLYFGENTGAKVAVVAISITTAIVVYYVSSIASAFFAIILGAALIAIFLKYSIPSIAVIIAAFSDMVITLAVVNILGIKLSTAGIAAFLMLIGYSVDTDILLSTRVIKRREGTVFDGVLSAMKTGLTMNLTTMTAVIIALIFSKSDILTQIMTILLIGLFADIINTWIQNAGILRWHLEKKKNE